MNEFELIRQYFATQTSQRPDVIIGIGDDAAILRVPEQHELVVTTDTLVAGVHFEAEATAYDIGYKALAVNLSDLAAMGATPAWFTIALTLPTADEDWVQGFCEGIFTLASRFQIQLVGGDLTQGPLSVTIQAMGLIPTGNALLRSGAGVGDHIYVTGTLGDAGLGLQILQENISLQGENRKFALDKLRHPEPRIATGECLRGLASAVIDISDGLAADLGHILEASNVGALIDTDKLPLSDALIQALPAEQAAMLALTSGDDYELCFTIPADKTDKAEQALSAIPCRFTHIGTITEESGITLLTPQGKTHHDTLPGYQHF